MTDSRFCPSRMLWLLLFSAAGCLASNIAFAQLTSCAKGTVCYYVAIQPIDVCSDTPGVGCAPFNTVNQNGSPGSVSSTNPVGFVDPSTGKDITRAMWNQIGVDISWSPMKQWNNHNFLSVATQNSDGTPSTQFQQMTGATSFPK